MVRPGTEDVDAFALVERNPDGTIGLVKKKPLPEFVLHEARIVAKDFGLPEDWLNADAADILVDRGLPRGLEGRLHKTVYGPKLAIHFKLYAAAADGLDSRHMQDLIALKPTSDELENAARWSMTHDISEKYKTELQSCLKFMGHPDVADRI